MNTEKNRNLEIEAHVHEILVHLGELVRLADINELTKIPGVTTADTIPVPPAKSRPAHDPVSAIRDYVGSTSAPLSEQVAEVCRRCSLSRSGLARLMHVNPARITEAEQGNARPGFKAAWVTLFGSNGGAQRKRPALSGRDALARFRAAVGKFGSNAVAKRLDLPPILVKNVFGKGFEIGVAPKVLRKFEEVYHA